MALHAPSTSLSAVKNMQVVSATTSDASRKRDRGDVDDADIRVHACTLSTSPCPTFTFANPSMPSVATWIQFLGLVRGTSSFHTLG